MTDDMKNEDIPRDDIPRVELLLGGQPSLDIDPRARRVAPPTRPRHPACRAGLAPVGSFAHRYRRSIEPALLIGLGGGSCSGAVHACDTKSPVAQRGPSGATTSLS